MAYPHVITALVGKYRRLSGELAACEKRAAGLRDDLSHLEASIRLFACSYNISGITLKRTYRRNGLFKSGELRRLAMDILRTAQGPLTSRELVMLTMGRKGIAEPGEQAIRQLRGTLNGCLTRREKAGLVVSEMVQGEKRWGVR